jgi:hypothetical protein
MDASGGRGRLTVDLAVVARWLFSWALALSRQGSEHQQVVYADIRKSSLAKCIDFTPLMTVIAEGRIVPCHYTGNLMYPEFGDSRFLQNVDTCLSNYMAARITEHRNFQVQRQENPKQTKTNSVALVRKRTIPT